MNACILTIGNELLQGFTIDTNSTWIAKTLEPYGVNIKKILTVGDDHDTIINESQKILENDFDFLFVTGGLGPTKDDITKNAYCDLFSDQIQSITISQPSLEKYYLYLNNLFKKQKKTIPEINKSQAMLLKKARSIPNDLGSALGIHYFEKNTHIFIMPGVPNEMKNIVQNYIIPDYLKTPPIKNCITIKTAGIMESVLAERIEPLMEKNSSDFSFSFLPHYTGVSFRIRCKNKKVNLDNIKNNFLQEMYPYAYGTDDDTLEKILAQKILKKKYSISTAESCTGGLISKRLINVPGSSKYFIGGITAYSNDIKMGILGVSKKSLEKYGSVSEEVALEMAKNIRKLMNVDIGISTTGISGPDGGTEDKPVGLVYIGIVMPNVSIVKKYIFQVRRSIHHEMVATAALNTARVLIDK